MFPFDENRKAPLSSLNIKGSLRASSPELTWKDLFQQWLSVTGGWEGDGEGWMDVAWREENKAADRKVSGSAAQGQQVVLGILQLRICNGINYTMLTCKHIRDVGKGSLCMLVKSRGQRLNVNVNELSDEEAFMAGDVRQLGKNLRPPALSDSTPTWVVTLTATRCASPPCFIASATMWIPSRHQDHACLDSMLPASMTRQVQ